MRAFAIFIWLVVLLGMTWFAIKNSQPVTLYGVMDYNWQAPLVLVLLAFFAGGVVLGLLASLGTVFKLKRQLSKMKSNQRKLDKAQEQTVIAQSNSVTADPAVTTPAVLPPTP